MLHVAILRGIADELAHRNEDGYLDAALAQLYIALHDRKWPAKQ